MNLCYFQADSEYAFRPVRYIEETTGPLETNDGRKISKYALVLPIDREHGLHDITVLVVVSKADLAATSEEIIEKIEEVKSRVHKWTEKIRNIKLRGGTDAPLVLPSGFLAVSAAT